MALLLANRNKSDKERNLIKQIDRSPRDVVFRLTYSGGFWHHVVVSLALYFKLSKEVLVQYC